MQPFQTHEVLNQVSSLAGYSLYDTDIALQEAVHRFASGKAEQDWLRQIGRVLGEAQALALGDLANRHPPILNRYDAQGHRIDRFEFHPAWHALMTGIVARGLHSGAWIDGGPGAHAARAAAYLMQGQVEAGTLCPTTMTFAAVPLLQREAQSGAGAIAATWLAKLASRHYDATDGPIADKRGALIGMGLTEKQGGSDLRGTRTQAIALATPGRGRAYTLIGHKWFYSVPQADAHMVLARDGHGLSCFLVPRWHPDGGRNAIRVQRLKDKLGNRSNASAEVEFENAWAVLVGEPGRGLATLLEMASATRLDCVLGSAAIMRQALVQAMHHASIRRAFGERLIDQPLMRNVLADLSLESEAATVLAMRLASLVDRRDDPAARLLLRIGTPAAKLWVGKRTIALTAECMEVCGGNGYIEEGPMARLFREAPVNSIWEGSGNIMALDVLRALSREEGVCEAFRAECEPALGIFGAFDTRFQAWHEALQSGPVSPWAARRLTVDLARLWQAALLIRHAPRDVSAAFVRARLQNDASLAGQLTEDSGTQAILHRAWPPIC